MAWSQKLPRTVRVRGGRVIRTRADARAYILALDCGRQPHEAWQSAARLLLDGADGEAVVTQLTLALMLDGKLDFAPRAD